MLSFTVQLLFLAKLGLADQPCGEDIPITGQGFHVDFYSYPLGSSAGLSNDYLLYNYEQVGPYIGSSDGVTNINFSSTEFIPGLGDVYDFQTTRGHFAMELTGYFMPPESGEYTFTLNKNDDALSLQFGYAENVGCCEIFDNQLNQANIVSRFTDLQPQTETFDLEAGIYYPIRLFYYNSIGARNLNLEITYPDMTVKDTFEDVYQLDSDYFCSPSATSTSSQVSLSTSTNSAISATESEQFLSSFSTMNFSPLRSSEGGSKALDVMTISNSKSVTSLDLSSSALSSMRGRSQKGVAPEHIASSQASSKQAVSDKLTGSLRLTSTFSTAARATKPDESRARTTATELALSSAHSRGMDQSLLFSSWSSQASSLSKADVGGSGINSHSSGSQLVFSSTPKSATKTIDTSGRFVTESQVSSSSLPSSFKNNDQNKPSTLPSGSRSPLSSFTTQFSSQSSLLSDLSRASFSDVLNSISSTDLPDSDTFSSTDTGFSNLSSHLAFGGATKTESWSDTLNPAGLNSTKSDWSGSTSFVSSTKQLLNNNGPNSVAPFDHQSGHASVYGAKSSGSSHADISSSGIFSIPTSANSGKVISKGSAPIALISATPYATFQEENTLSVSTSGISNKASSDARTINELNPNLSTNGFSGTLIPENSKSNALNLKNLKSITSTLVATSRPHLNSLSSKRKWSAESFSHTIDFSDAQNTQNVVTSNNLTSHFGTSGAFLSHSSASIAASPSTLTSGTNSPSGYSGRHLSFDTSISALDNKSKSYTLSKDASTTGGSKVNWNSLKARTTDSAEVSKTTPKFKSSELNAIVKSSKSSNVGSWTSTILNSSESSATTIDKPDHATLGTSASNGLNSGSKRITLFGSADSSRPKIESSNVESSKLRGLGASTSRGEASKTEVSSRLFDITSPSGFSKDATYSGFSSVGLSSDALPNIVSTSSLPTVLSATTKSTKHGASANSYGDSRRVSSNLAASTNYAEEVPSNASSNPVVTGRSAYSHGYLLISGNTNVASPDSLSYGAANATAVKTLRLGSDVSNSRTTDTAIPKGSTVFPSNRVSLNTKPMGSASNGVNNDALGSLNSMASTSGGHFTKISTPLASVDNEARGITESLKTTDGMSSNSLFFHESRPFSTFASQSSVSGARLNITVDSSLNLDVLNTVASTSIVLTNSQYRTTASGNVKTDYSEGINAFVTRSSLSATNKLGSTKTLGGSFPMFTSTPCTTCLPTSSDSRNSKSNGTTSRFLHSSIQEGEPSKLSNEAGFASAVLSSISSYNSENSSSTQNSGSRSSQLGISGTSIHKTEIKPTASSREAKANHSYLSQLRITTSDRIKGASASLDSRVTSVGTNDQSIKTISDSGILSTTGMSRVSGQNENSFNKSNMEGSHRSTPTPCASCTGDSGSSSNKKSDSSTNNASGSYDSSRSNHGGSTSTTGGWVNFKSSTSGKNFGASASNTSGSGNSSGNNTGASASNTDEFGSSSGKRSGALATKTSGYNNSKGSASSANTGGSGSSSGHNSGASATNIIGSGSSKSGASASNSGTSANNTSGSGSSKSGASGNNSGASATNTGDSGNSSGNDSGTFATNAGGSGSSKSGAPSNISGASATNTSGSGNSSGNSSGNNSDASASNTSGSGNSKSGASGNNSGASVTNTGGSGNSKSGAASNNSGASASNTSGSGNSSGNNSGGTATYTGGANIGSGRSGTDLNSSKTTSLPATIATVVSDGWLVVSDTRTGKSGSHASSSIASGNSLSQKSVTSAINTGGSDHSKSSASGKNSGASATNAGGSGNSLGNNSRVYVTNTSGSGNSLGNNSDASAFDTSGSDGSKNGALATKTSKSGNSRSQISSNNSGVSSRNSGSSNNISDTSTTHIGGYGSSRRGALATDAGGASHSQSGIFCSTCTSSSHKSNSGVSINNSVTSATNAGGSVNSKSGTFGYSSSVSATSTGSFGKSKSSVPSNNSSVSTGNIGDSDNSKSGASDKNSGALTTNFSGSDSSKYGASISLPSSFAGSTGASADLNSSKTSSISETIVTRVSSEWLSISDTHTGKFGSHVRNPSDSRNPNIGASVTNNDGSGNSWGSNFRVSSTTNGGSETSKSDASTYNTGASATTIGGTGNFMSVDFVTNSGASAITTGSSNNHNSASVTRAGPFGFSWGKNSDALASTSGPGISSDNNSIVSTFNADGSENSKSSVPSNRTGSSGSLSNNSSGALATSGSGSDKSSGSKSGISDTNGGRSSKSLATASATKSDRLGGLRGSAPSKTTGTFVTNPSGSGNSKSGASGYNFSVTATDTRGFGNSGAPASNNGYSGNSRSGSSVYSFGNSSGSSGDNTGSFDNFESGASRNNSSAFTTNTGGSNNFNGIASSQISGNSATNTAGSGRPSGNNSGFSATITGGSGDSKSGAHKFGVSVINTGSSDHKSGAVSNSSSASATSVMLTGNTKSWSSVITSTTSHGKADASRSDAPVAFGTSASNPGASGNSIGGTSSHNFGTPNTGISASGGFRSGISGSMSSSLALLVGSASSIYRNTTTNSPETTVTIVSEGWVVATHTSTSIAENLNSKSDISSNSEVAVKSQSTFNSISKISSLCPTCTGGSKTSKKGVYVTNAGGSGNSSGMTSGNTSDALAMSSGSSKIGYSANNTSRFGNSKSGASSNNSSASNINNGGSKKSSSDNSGASPTNAGGSSNSQKGVSYNNSGVSGTIAAALGKSSYNNSGASASNSGGPGASSTNFSESGSSSDNGSGASATNAGGSIDLNSGASFMVTSSRTRFAGSGTALSKTTSIPKITITDVSDGWLVVSDTRRGKSGSHTGNSSGNKSGTSVTHSGGSDKLLRSNTNGFVTNTGNKLQGGTSGNNSGASAVSTGSSKISNSGASGNKLSSSNSPPRDISAPNTSRSGSSQSGASGNNFGVSATNTGASDNSRSSAYDIKPGTSVNITGGFGKSSGNSFGASAATEGSNSPKSSASSINISGSSIFENGASGNNSGNFAANTGGSSNSKSGATGTNSGASVTNTGGSGILQIGESALVSGPSTKQGLSSLGPNWSKPTWISGSVVTITFSGAVSKPTTVTSTDKSGNQTISSVIVITPISLGDSTASLHTSIAATVTNTGYTASGSNGGDIATVTNADSASKTDTGNNAFDSNGGHTAIETTACINASEFKTDNNATGIKSDENATETNTSNILSGANTGKKSGTDAYNTASVPNGGSAGSNAADTATGANTGSNNSETKLSRNASRTYSVNSATGINTGVTVSEAGSGNSNGSDSSAGTPGGNLPINGKTDLLSLSKSSTRASDSVNAVATSEGASSVNSSSSDYDNGHRYHSGSDDGSDSGSSSGNSSGKGLDSSDTYSSDSGSYSGSGFGSSSGFNNGSDIASENRPGSTSPQTSPTSIARASSSRLSNRPIRSPPASAVLESGHPTNRVPTIENGASQRRHACVGITAFAALIYLV